MEIRCTVEELLKMVAGKEITINSTNTVNEVDRQPKIVKEQLKRLCQN